MRDENFSLDVFEKAVRTLEKAHLRYLQDKTDIEVRDSVIQRFEYTFELAFKTLKRFCELVMAASISEVEDLSYKDLIRYAAEKGLIDNPLTWFKYREERNKTSHTYDEQIAIEVFRYAEDFLKEAILLLNRMKTKMD